MKKTYKISIGQKIELSLDMLKQRNILVEAGKFSNVIILETGRKSANQGPTLSTGSDPDPSVKIIAESGAKISWYGCGENNVSLQVDLLGKKASVVVNELVVGKIGSESERKVLINHLAPETHSAFAGFALLQNNAKHYWNISTMIENKARKSVAVQRISNLLLGNFGVVKNHPALIIRNNDVVCTHSVTTGHLDEEQLFYLQARGLTREQGVNLLAHGFIAPIINLLPKKIQQEIADKFDQGPTLDKPVQGRSLVGSALPTNTNYD